MKKPSNPIPAPYKTLIEPLNTTSEKIRVLARAGYSRTEISKILEIRYQHVRKVLVDAGITEGLTNKVEATRSPLPVAQTPEETEPDRSWEILLKAGFQYIGDWQETEEKSLQLDGIVPKKPGVYALVDGDTIVYIGLTLNGLHTRMDQYRRGHKGQKTCARVKQLITNALAKGNRIKVLVVTPESLEWNGLPINAAAGLEAGLIQLLRPTWNIQGIR